MNKGVTKAQLQEIFLHARVGCGFSGHARRLRTAGKVIDASAGRVKRTHCALSDGTTGHRWLRGVWATQ